MEQTNIIQKIKNFIRTKPMVALAILVVFGFIVFFVLSFAIDKDSAYEKEQARITTEKRSVLELMGTDTDGDGITDWEESLWGTDKNNRSTFGELDTVYIERKKKELELEQESSDRVLTETDRFAREFFGAYTAMTSSGADPETINSFSEALGEKIANPNLEDKYSISDVLKSNSNTTEAKEAYYKEIQVIFDKYRNLGMGEELGIISSSLITQTFNADPGQINQLVLIADSYRGFAEDTIKIRVPESLAIYHLDMANSANNLAISVSNMTKVIDDPIIGLSGLSQYQKYSDDFISAATTLEENTLE